MKKLRLNKETIAQLNSNEMFDIRGGIAGGEMNFGTGVNDGCMEDDAMDFGDFDARRKKKIDRSVPLTWTKIPCKESTYRTIGKCPRV